MLVEESEGVAPAALGVGAPDEGVEGVDLAGVVTGLAGDAEAHVRSKFFVVCFSGAEDDLPLDFTCAG